MQAYFFYDLFSSLSGRNLVSLQCKALLHHTRLTHKSSENSRSTSTQRLAVRGVVCLQICCFHYCCATALYDEAGLYFVKKRTHLKLGDTRFLPDSDDIYTPVLCWCAHGFLGHEKCAHAEKRLRNTALTDHQTFRLRVPTFRCAAFRTLIWSNAFQKMRVTSFCS